MTKVDSIKQEPMVKVGIIIPEDKLTKVSISIPKSDLDNTVSGIFDINIYEDKLSLNEKLYEEISLTPDDPKDYLTIKGVPAGRGFHWQKTIDIKVSGIVNIQNIDGHILLINQLPLETYIKYVATSEMSAECPPALLEAQTIAARSWLLANRGVKHKDSAFDVCNDDCCQRYQGITELSNEIESAIQNTYGKVLTYNGKICDTRYSKCCGGITESFENVWDGIPIPYLSSIVDQENLIEYPDDIENFMPSNPKSYCSDRYINLKDLPKYLGKVDTNDNYFRWEIAYSADQLINILNDKLKLDIVELIDLIPLNRGKSGRITKLQIKFINSNNYLRSTVMRSEYSIRNALHEKFLYSSAFLIEKTINEQQIIQRVNFIGAGWGHGVGMCQIGALGMSLNNYNSDQILKHYFKNTKIVRLY